MPYCFFPISRSHTLDILCNFLGKYDSWAWDDALWAGRSLTKLTYDAHAHPHVAHWEHSIIHMFANGTLGYLFDMNSPIPHNFDTKTMAHESSIISWLIYCIIKSFYNIAKFHLPLTQCNVNNRSQWFGIKHNLDLQKWQFKFDFCIGFI